MNATRIKQFDADFLRRLGVASAPEEPELPATDPHLIAQLRQDLGATEAELQAAQQRFGNTLRSYERLAQECYEERKQRKDTVAAYERLEQECYEQRRRRKHAERERRIATWSAWVCLACMFFVLFAVQCGLIGKAY